MNFTVDIYYYYWIVVVGGGGTDSAGAHVCSIGPPSFLSPRSHLNSLTNLPRTYQGACHVGIKI